VADDLHFGAPSPSVARSPVNPRILTLQEGLGIRQRRPRMADPILHRAIEALASIDHENAHSEEHLAEFFVVAPGPGQRFPDGVRLRDDIATGLEASGWRVPPEVLGGANDFSRWRRRHVFKKRRDLGDRSPILIAEGDSWFHFPIFLRDVVLQLSVDHLIWPLGAAGGTLDHMVYGRSDGQAPDFLNAVSEWGDIARAFLFSGGGNDLLGEEPGGASSLPKFVRPHQPGRSAEWHVDTPEFHRRLVFYEAAYRHLIVEVGTRRPNLPIIVHAYDYALPCPFDLKDHRLPHWMAKDRFFGSVFPQLKIFDRPLQAAILRCVVDAMNGVQRKLAGGNVAGGFFSQVFHVDLRGVLASDDWADELHPTSAGYGKLSQRFRGVLQKAGVH
jgi:hypothetical protein